MNLDIVLLPPKILSRKLGDFVRKIDRQYGLLLPVDGRKLLHHVSLFHLNIPANHRSKLIKELKQIARLHGGGKLKFTNPHKGRKFFMADVNCPKFLRRLHQQTVLMVSKYRVGVTGLHSRKPGKADKIYYRKYGAGNLFENFTPHVTLGAAKNKKDLPKILRHLKQILPRFFPARRLALASVNKYYQVTKIIKQFKLK